MFASEEARKKLGVALDTADEKRMLAWAEQLGPYVGTFKIGLTAINAIALGKLDPKVISKVQSFCSFPRSIFWDIKLHDIPETMSQAAQVIATNPAIGVFNMHASAGRKGIAEVAKAKGDCELLCVTVLTSHDDQDVYEIFGDHAASGGVLKFARMAARNGADGVVCSPKEITLLRNSADTSKLKLYTPGIRPRWAAKNDQERIMTPHDAIKAGTDVMIIGRPITQPPSEIGSPVDAVKHILEEIEMLLILS